MPGTPAPNCQALQQLYQQLQLHGQSPTPDSKKHCLATLNSESCLEKLILPYIVLFHALQPSPLRAGCTSCRSVPGPKKERMPCPSGESRAAAQCPRCWRVKYSTPRCQHFPGTCVRHRPGAGHRQEITARVSEQKVPKELAAGDSARGGGSRAKR